MKKPFPFPVFLLGFMPIPLFASPMPEKGEVLAANTVLAEYVGVKDSPCRFLTADCPDRCGHATAYALFRVLENEGYQCPGEYGDGKAEAGSMLYVDIKKDIPGQDGNVARTIAELQPGEAVRMTVTHFYVDDKGSRYPIRPVTFFQKAGERSDKSLHVPEKKKIMPR